MWDADVAVVGGGLAGASLAHHCARDGLNVCLLSEFRLGAGGATAASRGILRLYDPDPFLMEWNVRGRAAWQKLEREEGIRLERSGLLYFLAATQKSEVLGRMAQLNLDEADIEVLTTAQAAERFPVLHGDVAPHSSGLVLYEPTSGYCNPQRVAQTLGEVAVRHGARIFEGARVTALRETSEDVRLTLSLGSEVRARCVVVAAGAGSSSLCTGLDLRAQVIPLVGVVERATVGAAPPLGPFPLTNLPCTIDEVAGCYTRPGESTGFFYCGGAGLRDPGADPTARSSPSAVAEENLSRLSRTRPVQSLMPVAIYEGTDAYTPNNHPRLGFIHPHSRIGLMTGFSGRGAKYIPAAAEAVAKQVCHKLGRLA